MGVCPLTQSFAQECDDAIGGVKQYENWETNSCICNNGVSILIDHIKEATK